MKLLSAETKKRYEAFWACEAYERCCLSITAPNPQAEPWTEIPSLEQKWADVPYRIRRSQYEVESSLYFGDAVPGVFVNFGPGCMTPCIGGSFRWAQDTVWFENEQVITDWSCPPQPVLDPESEMYQLVDSFTGGLLAVGKDRFYTSVTDIGGTLDILAALRGTQDLLMDLCESPEAVIAYIEKLGRVWRQWYDSLTGRLLAAQEGMVSWMPVYSPVRYYPLQCDFCAMISPEMFARFVLPDLVRMSEFLDRSIYHLDGPGEVCHLPQLLEMPRLNAIQWTSGAGKENVADECWFEMYQRIQAAGKGIVLLDPEPDKVENLLKHVSSKGLFLNVRVEDSRQAEELIRIAGAYGAR